MADAARVYLAADDHYLAGDPDEPHGGPSLEEAREALRAVLRAVEGEVRT